MSRRCNQVEAILGDGAVYRQRHLLAFRPVLWWERLSHLPVAPFHQDWAKICSYCGMVLHLLVFYPQRISATAAPAPDSKVTIESSIQDSFQY